MGFSLKFYLTHDIHFFSHCGGCFFRFSNALMKCRSHHTEPSTHELSHKSHSNDQMSGILHTKMYICVLC